MWIMSSPEFERYLTQYNDFISLVVDYHNRHQDFVHRITGEKAKNLKSILRKLRALEKDMITNVWDIYNIDKRGIEEAKRKKLEIREMRKKLNPPRRGRPPRNKTNGYNNGTTEESV
jgi:hypothetical protein